MKIKRLEISGFKSFADKVTLDFQQAVTGVVGPNGCGKSNIVDAIRWCMGEQSAKNLRGKAMEDVIFAGSETRKQLGVAEVSLIFSTEDGRAPARYLEYAEIQLTRRLFRDGESDYLINKTPCRLMDITELFMDTGVGARAYSIIEQGKIGLILHSKPEERRFLIEEAAGVTKFKSRKQLALKKIEGTRQNLSRLNDVLGEIRRQLASLQRQAKKAENFREYRDELREIELLFVARDYRDTQAARGEAERELAALNERIRELFAGAALGESQAEEARLRLLETERHLAVTQEDIYRARSEFSATESRVQFQRKELAALEGRLERLGGEAGERKKRLADCQERQGLLLLRRDSSVTDSAAMQDDLLRAEEDLAGRQQAGEELGRRLEARRKDLFTALGESSQCKFRAETAQKRLTGLAERIERHHREQQQLRERQELIGQRAVALAEQLTEAQQEQERLQAELNSLREQEADLGRRLPEVEQSWQSRRDDLSRASSRYHSLQELESRFAGYGQGVRKLMQDSGLRSSFSGVVADTVQAPPELEAAVEAVLSDRLQCILCANDNDAQAALQFLKGNNGGRAGIALPLEREAGSAPVVPGGRALVDLVTVSGPFGGLVRSLLAPALLVDSTGDAIRLARQYPERVFVTPDGDVVEAGGIVTGGSADAVNKGIIHKKREIRELEEAVALLERETASLAEERDGLRQRSREVAEAVKIASGKAQQVELRRAGVAKDRQQSADERARIEERLAFQAMEASTLDEERQGLEGELRQSRERLAEMEEAARGLEHEVARLKEELELHQEGVAAARERVTAIRIQTATLKEQHEARLRDIASLERQVEELTLRLEADHQELDAGGGERLRLQGVIALDTEQLEGLVRRQTDAEALLAAARTAFEEAGALLTEAEAGARKWREENDRLRQHHTELSLRCSSLSMQAEHLERSVQENNRITMAEALSRFEVAEFDDAFRRTRQTELRRLLDEMGEVNLLAIEECAGMEDRFNFLSSQKGDLEDSLRALQQAIQRINRTTRQRFLETYNQVNAMFQEVFPRLFCGGRAELRLTNEEDLLETGIDIIVQPPGKKLQNVTLLSGGEKALTAVALIFSIFLIKPTPFCLLDEVDAPLDDANIGRFNDMVREMSAVSQFIIITHNKATMQVADTLYGITMEEPGASRVVSVRLH